MSDYVKRLRKMGLHDVADYVARLEESVQWVDVKDRLPEEGSRVLVVLQLGDRRTIHTATYNELGWWLATYKDGTVLHWMPLPESPKEE